MATGPFKIPVVDDEPAVRAFLGDQLRQQGYQCVAATRPEQAIALFDGGAFDLILTDTSTPRLSGLNVLLCAKRRALDCRVVLITSQGTHDHVGQAFFLGAFDYVEKPFQAGELLSVVSRAPCDRAQFSGCCR